MQSMTGRLPLCSLPPHLPVDLITSTEGLCSVRGAVEGAAACCIDVEWEPGCSPPSATLVQLALRNVEAQERVLLLDMLALDMLEAKTLLQPLFRCTSTLKVGYGLKGDLSAIATALGPDGDNCIAVVQPQLEIGALQRLLAIRQVPGIHKASSPGLAGVVEAQLQLTLDKTQQCSSWGTRPLTPAQVRYAALDAYCLLMLLDDVMLHAPPMLNPLSPSEPGQATANADAAVPSPEDAAQAQGGDEPSAAGTACSAGSNSTACTAGSAGSTSAAGTAWPVLIAQAVEAWGTRLELKGGQFTRRRKRVPRSCRRKLQLDELAGWPQIIPWQADPAYAAAPSCPSSFRFACDVMVEGLARQLRLCGVNAICPDTTPKNMRHLVHRWLVETAEREGRVILTADRGFIAARLSEQAYFVQAATKAEQLQEVLQAFHICITQDDLLSRCVKCNGQFLPQAVPGASMPSETKPPEAVVQAHGSFWVCGTCGKAYWHGSQYSNAIEHLSQRLSLQGLA